ncbi:MAG TPA: hypothetical protein VFA18_03175, partial [Gemmataceae bacterium]|nr:hypothetical protein [Gemmataceae bacterium]
VIAYQNEQTRTQEAEKRYHQARQAVDLLIDVSENELADNPWMNSLRKQLLETALVTYQDFLEGHRDDPELVAVESRVRGILEELSILQGAFRGGLLNEADVLADLKLSPAQRSKVQELSRLWWQRSLETFRGFRGLTQAQRHERFVENARAQDAALKKVLSAAQLRRLKQIDLQVQGLRAFHDPDIVQGLKLTTQQRMQIHEIEAEVFEPPPGGPDRPPGPEHGRHHGPPPHHKREGKVRDAVARVVALLTPEQGRRWRQQVGEPFRTSQSPHHFGMPGPPDCPPPDNSLR